MTPAQLRIWLGAAVVGNPVSISPFAPGPPTVVQLPSTHPDNGVKVLYAPITVDSVLAAGGPQLRVRNAGPGANHGVYLPDSPNECTVVNATMNANGIVISGQFTGCSFVQSTHGGQMTVGHVFVGAAPVGAAANNPALQVSRFKTACGVAAPAPLDGTAEGFPTVGQVVGAANRGYVIGTFVGGWQWNWLQVSAANTVTACDVIAPVGAVVAPGAPVFCLGEQNRTQTSSSWTVSGQRRAGDLGSRA